MSCVGVLLLTGEGLTQGSHNTIKSVVLIVRKDPLWEVTVIGHVGERKEDY